MKVSFIIKVVLISLTNGLSYRTTVVWIFRNMQLKPSWAYLKLKHMQIFSMYLKIKRNKYKSTCNSLYMYMYVSTKRTIHRPLHCVLNLVNKQEKFHNLRHFCCAHCMFPFARHTRFMINNAMFKVIRPAVKVYGFDFVQNRSATYCYPFLYAGYSCCLFE